MNKKKTSAEIAHLASEVLRDPTSSEIAKSFAGSALSQYSTSKQPSKDLETKASEILKSSKYSALTKSLAASILSQADSNN